jgi:AcrR family transcriptional regulator
MALQTRSEILAAARTLFGQRGYAPTSIAEIAEEAGVAVQTIYSRLGSKHGILIALLDLIDEEAGVPAAAAAINVARSAPEALRAAVSLTRAFQERCGDIISTLTAAAGTEPELAGAVEEGRRRHRHGARLTINKIAALGGLRPDLNPDTAAALLSAATTHEAWRELVDGNGLAWNAAEQAVYESLDRSLLIWPHTRERFYSARVGAA